MTLVEVARDDADPCAGERLVRIKKLLRSDARYRGSQELADVVESMELVLMLEGGFLDTEGNLKPVDLRQKQIVSDWAEAAAAMFRRRRCPAARHTRRDVCSAAQGVAAIVQGVGTCKLAKGWVFHEEYCLLTVVWWL